MVIGKEKRMKNWNLEVKGSWQRKSLVFENANNRHARRDVSSPFAYDLENASFDLKHFSLSQSIRSHHRLLT